MKVVGIVHAECADGGGAAWAIRSWAKSEGHELELIFQKYDGPAPEISDGAGKIIIADFSFSREDTIALHERFGAENVDLLDHHVTAQEALKGLPNCQFDMSRSGAVMVWQHLFPGEQVPTILEYVQDRDIWKWEMPRSQEVNAFLSSWNHHASLRHWDDLARKLGENFEQVVAEGEAILRTHAQLVEQSCATAHMVAIDGDNVPAVHSSVLNSEIGVRLLELFPDAPFAAIYTKLAGRTTWSLRSRSGGHNVSETARRMGGGGHPAASGYTEWHKSGGV